MKLNLPPPSFSSSCQSLTPHHPHARTQVGWLGGVSRTSTILCHDRRSTARHADSPAADTSSAGTGVSWRLPVSELYSPSESCLVDLGTKSARSA